MHSPITFAAFLACLMAFTIALVAATPAMGETGVEGRYPVSLPHIFSDLTLLPVTPLLLLQLSLGLDQRHP